MTNNILPPTLTSFFELPAEAGGKATLRGAAAQNYKIIAFL